MIFDSDILIGFIRGEKAAKKKFDTMRNQGKKFQITVITACELWQGVFVSKNPSKNAMILQDLLEHFVILEFTSDDAIQYGQIYGILKKKGKMIGLYDIMIAATALRLKERLVTHNIQHFSQIPLLKIEDWKVKV
ncbi:MAG: type II toxin-antitoxin system VapC family toxin [Promethearchaeota archaeon]